eukprot:22572-Eustigmatos_ZCMA.PRE.1
MSIEQYCVLLCIDLPPERINKLNSVSNAGHATCATLVIPWRVKAEKCKMDCILGWPFDMSLFSL